jgi:hypothetical protein
MIKVSFRIADFYEARWSKGSEWVEFLDNPAKQISDIYEPLMRVNAIIQRILNRLASQTYNPLQSVIQSLLALRSVLG